MRFLSSILTVLLLFPLTLSAQRNTGYLELKGRQVTLRQDLSRGGAICYLGRGRAERNYVNISDEGRYSFFN